MHTRTASLDCPKVLWILAVYAGLSVFDGFIKIQLANSSLIYFWVFDLTKWLILPVALILVLQNISKVLPRDYGLSADLGTTDVVALLPLTTLSLFVVHFLVERITYAILQYPTPPFNNQAALAALGPLWIVGTFYFSVTAGLWESIFFIGLPWLWGRHFCHMSLWRTRGFVIASALVFGLAHWENGIPNVAGGIAFQLYAFWWYLRLGTLWPTIAAHVLIDLYYFWPPVNP